jgi:hypothetical protein
MYAISRATVISQACAGVEVPAVDGFRDEVVRDVDVTQAVDDPAM